MSGKNEFLTELDFVVAIKREVWDQLTPNDREALVDEALTLCSLGGDRKDGTPTWYKQAFDFRGFRSVLRRYGLWNADLKLIEAGLQDKNQVTLEEVIEGNDSEAEQPPLQLVQ